MRLNSDLNMAAMITHFIHFLSSGRLYRRIRQIHLLSACLRRFRKCDGVVDRGAVGIRFMRNDRTRSFESCTWNVLCYANGILNVNCFCCLELVALNNGVSSRADEHCL